MLFRRRGFEEKGMIFRRREEHNVEDTIFIREKHMMFRRREKHVF